jgi:hypothetical protein
MAAGRRPGGLDPLPPVVKGCFAALHRRIARAVRVLAEPGKYPAKNLSKYFADDAHR